MTAVVHLEPSVGHTVALVQLAAARLTVLGSPMGVYRDDVPASPTYPYVVFWSAPGEPLAAAERLAGWGGEITTTTQATVVGLTPDDVLGATDRVVLALHRQRPTIAGRQVGDAQLNGAVARPQRDPVAAADGQKPWATFLIFTLQSSPITNSEGA